MAGPREWGRSISHYSLVRNEDLFDVTLSLRLDLVLHLLKLYYFPDMNITMLSQIPLAWVRETIWFLITYLVVFRSPPWATPDVALCQRRGCRLDFMIFLGYPLLFSVRCSAVILSIVFKFAYTYQDLLAESLLIMEYHSMLKTYFLISRGNILKSISRLQSSSNMLYQPD